ncbi:conserved hypothetical protein [Anaeromyxobacter sp. K]|uniref:Uncharacterized protein n=1 Tax=Anaeromyxobacter dehalogenans (strain ATCC BAA-258 / DSM 21875 / 2CP-1) TaxID=455488 RepID=B8JH90_ANAD2|nr:MULTISPECIES: hypothetical protein [Anaeromyxobacter]ACG72582.1 conserved hypothetical protein [Anaeromyxobacter sp. K]ACL64792.1 conserved hypothetical protein [Anaeromyxobacter dehalogenans 2CP-1]
MPIDRGYEDDDDVDQDEGSGRRFQDFDCPDCSANNPYDDGFGDGDEVRCFYCGQDFAVVVTEAGRLRLKTL